MKMSQFEQDTRAFIHDAVAQGIEQHATYDIALGFLVVPYGKFKGEIFRNVPLKYLDEVVSKYPDTWISRMSRRYVDFAMNDIMYRLPNVRAVPNVSYKQSLEEFAWPGAYGANQ